MNFSFLKTLNQRLQLLYGIILIAVLALIGLLGFWIADYRDAYPMAMVSFLVLGILHVYLLSQWFDPLFENKSVKAIGFTLLVTLLAAILIIFLFHKLSNELTKGAGMATALVGFMFPIFVARVYQNYLEIPLKEYKKWYYPVGQPLPDMDLLDLSRVLVIQFEFTKKFNETAFTNFRAKAPNAMLFGELFFIFLNDYNDRNPASPIEYLAANGTPYGWLFYQKSPWYKRRKYMDPDLTFQANGVLDNETIVAIRG
ncbi:TssN family type VI secretion system protein [Dyadobacter sp. CY323]|uniref:TssN family type VI secretion system protein n=1 Tax=Dyadobacter sp. CY323 TaxID=2907302 RepID=UPI001F318CFA|nr:TssN family type VI secretion system protein [Dyadobacter sp. CY323]MCE6988884.1 TssN family type VI secretion system protein [Dyadobacter sp. CY323]